MRENRPYGSEGGVAMSHPYPYRSGRSPRGPTGTSSTVGVLSGSV